jgi:predicted 3-demethylubiquinone-9 3-methyltransferase (glyoxalase superfamily)
MAPQKITPFIWFDTQAEEAAKFYVSLFKDSCIHRVVPGPTGAPMIVEFELAGASYIALNGGPHYKLTEAFSLSVSCADQSEIDELWERLSAGGAKSQCGWLTDRFGLSWQIVPAALSKLMSDPQRSGRVMQALMQMTKIEIQKLQDAFESES